MTLYPEVRPVLMGVGATLAAASVVGFVLHRRSGDGPHKEAIANLNARIRAWWVMIALAVTALLAGRVAVTILFAVISFLALREFVTLSAARGSDHRALAACFLLALPGQYYLVATGWYGLFCVFIPVYGFLILPVLAALSADSKNFLVRTAETQWGLMICVYCISHVPALLMLEISGYEDRGILLGVFLVTVVQASDVLQYIWGKLLGRHKIAPELSPSKTVEGLLGGLASAVALGVLMTPLTPFRPMQAAAMSLAIALMGFLGGLVMSAIKRDLGVKDWGHSIAGHGGILDRVDSICFSAPIFFHLVRYFFLP